MKVLLINGSPRKEGNTNLALQTVAQQLGKHGVDSEMVWVGNRPVRGCIACNKCRDNGKKQRCIFNDDPANTIIEKMEQCDAIIIGAPVYYGQPAGQMLCMEQRMLYAGRDAFAGKPASAIAVCRRGGSTASYQTLLMPFQMLNMPIVTSQYWNIVFGSKPGEAALDEEGLQTMRTLANNMAWMLNKIHGVATTDAPVNEPVVYQNFIR